MATEKRVQEVSLGCGTLILIGLIVLIFSRTSTQDVEAEVRQTRAEMQRLSRSVEALADKLDALDRKLDRLVPAAGAPEREPERR